jgi:hypothetical protein
MANSSDEALAGMAKQGRTPMGKDGVKFTDVSSKGTGRAKLVKKGGAQAGDPTGMGTKANKANVARSTNGEREGAAYKIAARIYKPNDPAAGLTQANGRVISTATNRDRGNFDGGNSASY